MKTVIYKCDRCKKEIKVFGGCGKLTTPKTIKLFNNYWGYKNEETIEYELCSDCYKKVFDFVKEHEDE